MGLGDAHTPYVHSSAISEHKVCHTVTFFIFNMLVFSIPSSLFDCKYIKLKKQLNVFKLRFQLVQGLLPK